MKRTLILGGPGSGKTERLLRVVEESLLRGIPPSRIAFVGFTKSACLEARTRAERKFNLSPKDLPHFRTIHSLAFRGLGMKKTDVISYKHYEELSAVVGEQMEDDWLNDGPAQGRLLTLDHYSRVTTLGLRRAWEDHGGEVDWHRLKRFSLAYGAFKNERGLYDFTDMLSLYTTYGVPVDVDVAIIDEVQDLAKLQYLVLLRAFGKCQEMWSAGDDDQAIHTWAGADISAMFDNNPEIEVLKESHRLPQAVFNVANSIVSKIVNRKEKSIKPKDMAGTVEWYHRLDEVDLSKGSWLILARTKSQLDSISKFVKQQGIPHTCYGSNSVDKEHVKAIRAYEGLRAGKRVESQDVRLALRYAGITKELDDNPATAKELNIDCSTIWHDALVRMPLEAREHYLGALRRGEKLDVTPRVRIDTIHAAKGLEADHVCLMTDLTHRTRKAYELDPDSEHRVFYVGATRSKETLSIVVPSNAGGYSL